MVDTTEKLKRLAGLLRLDLLATEDCDQQQVTLLTQSRPLAATISKTTWVLSLLLLVLFTGCTWYNASDVPCFGGHHCPSQMYCAQEGDDESGVCWYEGSPTPWCSADHGSCERDSDCCSLRCSGAWRTCVTPCSSSSECPGNCCAIISGEPDMYGVCTQLSGSGLSLYCGSYNGS